MSAHKLRLHGLDLAGVAAGALLLATGAGVALWGEASAVYPVHYGLDGIADRWGERGEIAAFAAVMGLATILSTVGMGWWAGRAADSARARGLRVAQALSLIAFAVVGALFVCVGVARQESIGAAVPMAALSVLFIAIGALTGRVAPNPIVGVRTPWSYKSRLAWDRSNRLAGRLFLLIGVAGLIAAAWAPQPAGVIGLVVAVVVAALWAVVESWRVWRSDPDRQPF